jgi:hypothetical protein
MFGSRERRTRREAEAAEQVRGWYQRAAAGGLTMARVQAVQGRHRQGTRAYLRVDVESFVRDAWVWGRAVRVGDLVVGRAVVDRGPHTRRPGVLSVDEVAAVIPAAVVRRADRHHRRVARPRPVVRPPAERRRTRLVAAYDR